MNIPRAWASATGEARTRENRRLALTVWGWGGEEATARREAASRLQRLLERIGRGELCRWPEARLHLVSE